jgi:hypothetical protein
MLCGPVAIDWRSPAQLLWRNQRSVVNNRLYFLAGTSARSVTTKIYDRESGGAEHCQMGAPTLWHADLFGRLSEKFESRP